jgi:hypothetical protein
MPWWDRDEDDKPPTRSLSAKMWSTSDKRPTRGSLNTTNNARMFSTSDGTGGNLRVTPSRTRPRPPDPLDAIRDRLRTLRQDDNRGDRNPRTNRFTASWKPAPGPGTVKEARARQEQGRKRTQFRRVTSTVDQNRTRVAARRGGFATSPEKTLAARRNAIKGGRYGYKGGRPRTTAPRPVQAPVQAQVRNRGWFTRETARLAGSRSTPAKTRAAQLNARKPRRRAR